MTYREQSGYPASFAPPVRRAKCDTTSRHHVGSQPGMHPEDMPMTTDEPRHTRSQRQLAQRFDPSVADVELGEDELQTRMPTSARRYQPTQAIPRQRVQITHHHAIPPRSRATQDQQPQTYALQTIPRSSQPGYARPHVHWLVYVGLVLLLFLIGWVLVTIIANWWNTMQDNWHYGYPRTYQTDAVVGQDSASHPTHFIVENLKGSILIIEVHAGDPTKVTIIVGPVTRVGPGSDLDPVTLQFEDVNHDGQPDMLVCFNSNRYVYLNDHGTFRLPRPGEAVGMTQ